MAKDYKLPDGRPAKNIEPNEVPAYAMQAVLQELILQKKMDPELALSIALRADVFYMALMRGYALRLDGDHFEIVSPTITEAKPDDDEPFSDDLVVGN